MHRNLGRTADSAIEAQSLCGKTNIAANQTKASEVPSCGSSALCVGRSASTVASRQVVRLMN
jgi:hypothetical protein